MEDFKIIYYYQTFNGLSELLSRPLIKNINIYICSLHFNTDNKGNITLHLNDNLPEYYSNVWKEINEASKKGNRILCMLGGAGGAYTTLFNKYDICYPLLKSFLKKYKVIKGIDLDIEEYVELNNIKKLINQINIDFGDDYIITMAPVQYALANDLPGLGGFCYKDLYKSIEGSKISWFNCQSYNDYSINSYNDIINNGYPSNKIVYGMIGDQTTGNLFKTNILPTINSIYKKYPYMSGVFIWEYFMKPTNFAEDIIKNVPVQCMLCNII